LPPKEHIILAGHGANASLVEENERVAIDAKRKAVKLRAVVNFRSKLAYHPGGVLGNRVIGEVHRERLLPAGPNVKSIRMPGDA